VSAGSTNLRVVAGLRVGIKDLITALIGSIHHSLALLDTRSNSLALAHARADSYVETITMAVSPSECSWCLFLAAQRTAQGAVKRVWINTCFWDKFPRGGSDFPVLVYTASAVHTLIVACSNVPSWTMSSPDGHAQDQLVRLSVYLCLCMYVSL